MQTFPRRGRCVPGSGTRSVDAGRSGSGSEPGEAPGSWLSLHSSSTPRPCPQLCAQAWSLAPLEPEAWGALWPDHSARGVWFGKPPGVLPAPHNHPHRAGPSSKGQRASCNGVSRSLVLAEATAVAGAAVWGRGTAERTGRRAAGHGRPPPSSSSLCGEGTRFTPLTLREEEATGRGAASGGAGLRGECPAF